MNKLLTSNEQVPTVVKIRLKTGKTTIPGRYGVGCRVYGVLCRVVPHSCGNKAPPPAGDWLAGAWAELGNKTWPGLKPH